MKYGFGIDVGGTTVKMGFFSEDGTLLHSWEIPTDCTENGRHILPDIAKAVQAHLAQTGIGHESVLVLASACRDLSTAAGSLTAASIWAGAFWI